MKVLVVVFILDFLCTNIKILDIPKRQTLSEVYCIEERYTLSSQISKALSSTEISTSLSDSEDFVLLQFYPFACLYLKEKGINTF